MSNSDPDYDDVEVVMLSYSDSEPDDHKLVTTFNAKRKRSHAKRSLRHVHYKGAILPIGEARYRHGIANVGRDHQYMLLFHTVFCISAHIVGTKADKLTIRIMEFLYFHGKAAWSFEPLTSSDESPFKFTPYESGDDFDDFDQLVRHQTLSMEFNGIIEKVHETAFFWPRPDEDDADHEVWDFVSDTDGYESSSPETDLKVDPAIEADFSNVVAEAIGLHLPVPMLQIIVHLAGGNFASLRGDQAFRIACTKQQWDNDMFFLEDGLGHLLTVVGRVLRIWNLGDMQLMQEIDIGTSINCVANTFMLATGILAIVGIGNAQLFFKCQSQCRPSPQQQDGSMAVRGYNCEGFELSPRCSSS